MKKKVLATIFSTFILSTAFSENVLATEVESSTETLGSNLTVEVLNDDRLAPIENTDELESKELDLILERIGYSADQVDNWDINRKRRFASYGGKVVDGKNEPVKEEYLSADGTVYDLDTHDHKTIRNVQLEDLKEKGVKAENFDDYDLIEEDSVSDFNLFRSAHPGHIEDGIFSGSITVTEIGETRTQYRYIMSLDYTWSKQPKLNLGDSAGLGWGSYGQPVANTARGVHAVNYLGHWTTFDHDINVSNNYGVTSDIRYSDKIFGNQMGYLEEEVWVDKRYSGRQLALSGVYIHPWLPNGWTISVGAGGLSVDTVLDQIGNKWTLRYNFTPR